MKLSAAALCIAISGGCATADYAQMADVTTTAVFMETGLGVEGNPVWGGANWPVMIVVKLGVNEAIKHTPTETCEPLLMFSTMLGSGAALWNIGVIAGCGPAAIPVIIGLTWWQWDAWQASAIADCKKPFFFAEKEGF